jgi:hypothetical protein
MRFPGADWIGSFGLTFLMMAAVPLALAQSLPSAGINALDEAATEPSLLPAAGLTLDAPTGFDQFTHPEGDEPRPSDGLGLRIYDPRPIPPEPRHETGREAPPDDRNP